MKKNIWINLSLFLVGIFLLGGKAQAEEERSLSGLLHHKRTLQVNLSHPGPYAPSCQGNPVFPRPDYRCCEFGPQALCYTFNLSCPRGQRIVGLDLYCSGYVAHDEALVVGRIGRSGVQVGCEKRDGNPGGVNLYGRIECGRGRGYRRDPYDRYDPYDPYDDFYDRYGPRPPWRN